jgi:hypothetical protein
VKEEKRWKEERWTSGVERKAEAWNSGAIKEIQHALQVLHEKRQWLDASEWVVRSQSLWL